MIATVQRGSKALSTTALTDSVTLPVSVDATLTIFTFTMRTANGTNRHKRRAWNAVQTSGTNVNLERLDNGDATVETTIEWEATTFQSGEIASLQKNATAENPTADPLNVTVTAVTTNLCVMGFNYATLQNGPMGGNRPTMYLSTTTNIEFDFNSAPASNDFKAFWWVLQFNSGDVTIQTSTISISGTTTSTTGAPGTNFGATTDTVLFLSYRGDAGSDTFNRALLRIRATAVDTLTLDRTSGTIGSGSAEVARWHSLEFLDATIAQYVDADMVSASSAAPAISAVTTARASCIANMGWYNGRREHTVGTLEPESFATLLVGASDVTATRTVTTGTLQLPVYVIEWEAAGGGGGATIPVFDHHYRTMRAA